MKKFIDESWLVLVMGICFAAMLAGTQTKLQPKIEANEAKALNEAIEKVVPGVASREELTIAGSRVFKCLDANGQLLGWAVEAAGPGFIDKITVVVGLAPDGSLVNAIKATKHLETPGLGNKINEGNPYPTQYQNKSTATPFVIVKHKPTADHEIEAITGATYSSTYVMDIVNDVITRIRPQLAEHR